MRIRPRRFFWRGTVAWRRLSPRRRFRGRSVLCPENWTVALGLSRGLACARRNEEQVVLAPDREQRAGKYQFATGLLATPSFAVRKDAKDGVGLADERSTAEWRWV